MRATLFGLSAACLLLAGAAQAAPIASDNETAIETMNDREAGRLQGRHHYLYDDESQPTPTTTGSAATDARACASEPVRVQRADGTTALRRFNRCD